jgi:DNA (cytosine-5)-methyltransferase 1
VVILSLFPGIDLLGRAFEAEGFCVVRGPDPLWGGDIRAFHPPAGCCWGIIAGSPCQDFSQARRAPPTGRGLEMLGEFSRVVAAVQPAWWLLENVPRVPDVQIRGYWLQRLDLNQAWYSAVHRLRHVQFGSRDGRTLQIPRGRRQLGPLEPAALANDSRGFREVCRLQGLPEDYDLPGFTIAAKIAAVGNGVPIVLGRQLARAVRRAYRLDVGPEPPDPEDHVKRICRCGCGREVNGKADYAGATCRKRSERARRRDSPDNTDVTSERLPA